MLKSFIPLVIASLCIAIAVWAVFMWAVKSGQFDDIEGPKHRMLDDDDDEPPTDEPEKGETHEDLLEGEGEDEGEDNDK